MLYILKLSNSIDVHHGDVDNDDYHNDAIPLNRSTCSRLWFWLQATDFCVCVRVVVCSQWMFICDENFIFLIYTQ